MEAASWGHFSQSRCFLDTCLLTEGGVGDDEATNGGEVMTAETGHATGTPDKDYNIIWFLEACLSNALRLESYIQDAERAGDTELAEFFRRAQGESRKGAAQAKQLLKQRLDS
jgi:hypothetical protein